jgi:hypothetical protein
MTTVFKPCAVDGCNGNAHHAARGRREWCNMHYLRWMRSGKPEGVRTPNGVPLKYMLDHMWDECPKWPFYRHACGYGEMTYEGRRGQRVHRIVCEMVNGPPPTPDHEAAHNCGKGHEGCFGASCLQWKTRIENVRDAQLHGTWVHGETVPSSKLKENEVVEIYGLRHLSIVDGEAGRVGSKYGVDRSTVMDIWRHRSWRWLTKNCAHV